MLSNIFDRVSFWALFAVIALLPVFFAPFTHIPIDISKGLLLVAGVVVSIVFWAMARFSDGRIVLPRSWLLLSGCGVLSAMFLSALFSGTLQVSLFGIMLDVGSFYFMLATFLLMLTSSVILQDVKDAKLIFLG